MPAEKRTCTECKRKFQRKGSKVTCSPACAAARLNRQLAQHATKRRKPMRTFSCAICGKSAQSSYPCAKYCCDSCRVAGLERAVEAQRVRRKAEKSKAK